MSHPDEEDFLASVRASLPDQSRNVIDRLSAVKSTYVECGRDTLLDSQLLSFLEAILTEKEHGRRDEGAIFFVTGESGAGKSMAADRMLARVPALQPRQASYGLIQPVIRVSLRGPAILRTVGEQIMNAARGYVSQRKLSRAEVWDEMPEELRHRKVLIVHIDEPQHLLKENESNLDRKDLADALKGIMNHVQWPVSFLLSGLPQTDQIAKLDEQFERRGWFVRLSDVQMPEERDLVEKIVRELSAAGSINCEDLLATDVPERIAHAARFRYGRIAQVTTAALQCAFQKGGEKLTREHFVTAYNRRSHSVAYPNMNPFIADDWQRLPPGSFILDEDDG